MRAMAVRHRILVVEDHVDSAEMLATFLGALGHEVMTAHDAESALAVAAKDAPTLAVLDVGLPTADGFELSASLRALYPSLVIVVLSAYASPDHRRRASENGIAAYLTKPVDLVELEAFMRSLPE